MVLSEDKCVGCGRCIAMCPFDAIFGKYDEKMDIVNCKIVEYTKAIVDRVPTFNITLITDVSPLCDCHDNNDMPIIPNVGMLASKDPVAIDLASVDLSQQQPMLPGSILFKESNGVKPDDIFAVTNKDTHWQSHFEHAKKMGLGDGTYNLIKL